MILRRILPAILGVLGGAIAKPAQAIVWPTDWEVAFHILRDNIPRYTADFNAWKWFTKEISDLQANSIISGHGRFGDYIRQGRTDSHNIDIKRATEPPPKACSDGSCSQHGEKTRTQTKIKAAEYSLGGDIGAAQLTTENARGNKLSRLRGTIQAPGGIPDQESVLASPLMHPYGAEQNKNLQALVQRLVGEADELATVGPIDEAGAGYEELRASHLSRLSVIRYALTDMMSRRERSTELLLDLLENATPEEKTILTALATPEGLSYMDLLQYDLLRTHASPAYRDTINSYADMTPVSKAVASVCMNSVALAELKLQQIEIRTLLLSVIAVLLIERKQNSRELARQYMRAV